MAEDIHSSSKESQGLYNLCHQEYTIMAEYRMLQTENLQGIYVIPSHESSFLWFGVIFVRSGYYEDGVFRFTITLPETFPSEEVPVVVFNSNLYHPAVDLISGLLNLMEVFPEWDPNKNHLWQILKYIYWIFHNINVKSPLNMEASVMYKSNPKLFHKKAKESVAASIEHLYDDPPTDDKHYITFTPYDADIHDPVKQTMLRPVSPTGHSQGLSWVQTGSYQPFSKDDGS